MNKQYDANDPTINRYLTSIIKGEPNHWSIQAGDARSGGLSAFYDGVRPNLTGYDPMKKEARSSSGPVATTASAASARSMKAR